MWMKLTLSPTRLCCASTMSTVGPHVRDLQNRGVANVTISGLPALSASAIDSSCIEHTGVRVQIGSTPCAFVVVGLCDARARLLTTGDGTFASIWNAASTGWLS